MQNELNRSPDTIKRWVDERSLRAIPSAIVDAKAKRSVCQVGPIEVDIDRHEAIVDGKSMDLTPREFAVVLGSLAELGAALSEHPQERNFVLFEQRQHPVVEDGASVPT